MAEPSLVWHDRDEAADNKVILGVRMQVREIEPDITKYVARQCSATADSRILQDDILGRETTNHGVMSASERKHAVLHVASAHPVDDHRYTRLQPAFDLPKIGVIGKRRRKA